MAKISDVVGKTINSLNLLSVHGMENLAILHNSIEALTSVYEALRFNSSVEDQLNKEVQNERNNQDSRSSNGES